MKKKLAIIVAVLLGMLSVLLINYYLKQKEREYELRSKGREVVVLVAAKNIPAESLIEEDMINTATIPEKYIQPKVAYRKEKIIGKFALAPIMQGEQILMTKLGTEEQIKKRTEEEKRVPGRLSMNMPIGKRALTVPVGLTDAAGGSIRQGDHVDVLGVFAADKLKLQPEAKTAIVTLLQDILVLAATGSSITLALSPEEAGIITVAQNEGKVLFVLRPQAETGEHLLPLVNMKTLTKRYAPAVIIEPEEGVIEIFRGLKRETIPLSSIPTGKEQ